MVISQAWLLYGRKREGKGKERMIWGAENDLEEPLMRS